MINAVVMADGSSTRLWPLSRAAHPKQFLAVHGDYTMLQATRKRLDGLDVRSSVTVCNEEHCFFVAEQLESGNYYWNSGLFLLKASRYQDELKKHRPDIFESCRLSMEVTSIDNDCL